VGEVALTGEVRSVPGVLPMAILAEKLGYKRIFLPDENAAEASVVRGIEVLPVRMFDEIVHHSACSAPRCPSVTRTSRPRWFTRTS